MRQPVTLGLDVGGTKVLGLALDASGEVLAEERAPTPVTHVQPESGTAREALIASMVAVAERVAETVDLGAERRAVSLGIGAPGLVDDAGVLRFAPNLPVGTGLDIAGLLRRRLGGWRVVVDNDSTCAAVGEWIYGAAAGVRDAVMVTLGTGIGGGIVADGQVVRGVNGFAGEIGHMVVDPSGPVCPCGRRGCWERYASGSGLGRLAREAAHAGRLKQVVDLAGGDPEAVRGEHVTQAALAGDDDALAVLDGLGRWLALGLVNLANILDTETFVIGGGLVNAVGVVLETVRVTFDEMMEGRHQRPEVRIVTAALGERAGAIGAALVAREGEVYQARERRGARAR